MAQEPLTIEQLKRNREAEARRATLRQDRFACLVRTPGSEEEEFLYGAQAEAERNRRRLARTKGGA